MVRKPIIIIRSKDLKTGKRLALAADLFVEGADYITPISENIKAADEGR